MKKEMASEQVKTQIITQPVMDNIKAAVMAIREADGLTKNRRPVQAILRIS